MEEREERDQKNQELKEEPWKRGKVTTEQREREMVNEVGKEQKHRTQSILIVFLRFFLFHFIGHPFFLCSSLDFPLFYGSSFPYLYPFLPSLPWSFLFLIPFFPLFHVSSFRSLFFIPFFVLFQGSSFPSLLFKPFFYDLQPLPSRPCPWHIIRNDA